MSVLAHRSNPPAGRRAPARPERSMRSLRRRPALLLLVAVYALALTCVRDPATVVLGISVAACTGVRVTMIARRSRRRTA